MHHSFMPLASASKENHMNYRTILAISICNIAFWIAPTSAIAIDTSTSQPIVIGHRGAAGYMPEHTLESYQLAIEMGADYVEPDLVSTSDGVLIARHTNALAIVNPITNAVVDRTTDVASHAAFAGRRTTKIVDGVQMTGWFSEDFTLAEIKTLRCLEWQPLLRPQSAAFDGQFQIPTLQEIIDLVQSYGHRRNRRIGLYPETKHPSYFRALDLAIEEPLVRILRANGYKNKNDEVYIQSFEVGNLMRLRSMTKVPLVQLIDEGGQPFDFAQSGDPRTYADLAAPSGLAEIATYADGVGVNKNLIVPRDATGEFEAPTDLVEDAHSEGLLVHAWTFRNENYFLPPSLRLGDPAHPFFLIFHGDSAAEYTLFFNLGVDGVFSDHPNSAVAVRDLLFP
jgi:glycerophosphoryl diester phosphodiesterase